MLSGAAATALPSGRLAVAPGTAQGRVIRLRANPAPSRRQVAADEKQVAKTLATLPFARFFDADVYPTTPPDAAEAAHRAGS